VTLEGSSGPLAGLTVLVPRASGQAGGFSALLRERGAEALEVPAIEIRPVASTAGGRAGSLRQVRRAGS